MVPITYNVRSLLVRKISTIASLVGIALVVVVSSCSSMLSNGIARTLKTSGRADTAIIMRMGSDAEMASGIDVSRISTVVSNPNFVAQDKSGNSLGVGEIVVVKTADRAGTTGGVSVSNVSIRGVPANVWDVRDDVKIVRGRKPQPGTDEVAIGKALPGRFQGVEFGANFELKKNRVAQVVGVFDAGGSAFESEIWADVDTVRQAFGRQGVVSSVRVRLLSPSKFEAFKTFVESDKTLGLMAQREDSYYEKQTEGMAGMVKAIGWVFAFLFSLGAMIGAAITMYAQVANRSKEVGTLRALGFSRFAILLSFLVESVMMCFAGGVLGVLLALPLGLVEFPMMNMATWAEVVFRFEPSAGTIIGALVFATVMGIVGGFFPAWRASKLSPVEAMRT
ncbi:MAG TPA: FtsX-like permease family protein [Haliangiales bacterium]|nr:FtsX-like permease family protein [Haliangiales bacterium]